jgi:hypothetical protein
MYAAMSSTWIPFAAFCPSSPRGTGHPNNRDNWMMTYTINELKSKLGYIHRDGVPFKISREARPQGKVVAHIEVKGRPLESVLIADESAAS